MKVALKNVVDDFAIYAVEQGLLTKVQTIFAPASIFSLSEDIIQDIAGETEDSVAERDVSTTKLAILKKALDVLKRLDRRQSQGMSEVSPFINIVLTVFEYRPTCNPIKSGRARDYESPLTKAISKTEQILDWLAKTA